MEKINYVLLLSMIPQYAVNLALVPVISFQKDFNDFAL